MSSSFEPSRPGTHSTPSPHPAQHPFPHAWVYESTTLAWWPHALPPKAWLAFAYNLTWLYVESDAVPPRTLVDFREHHCLVLDRLNGGFSWGDVEREVCPLHGNTDNLPRPRRSRTPWESTPQGHHRHCGQFGEGEKRLGDRSVHPHRTMVGTCAVCDRGCTT